MALSAGTEAPNNTASPVPPVKKLAPSKSPLKTKKPDGKIPRKIPQPMKVGQKKAEDGPPKPELVGKRPSKIPKLKQLAQINSKNRQKIEILPSTLVVKQAERDIEHKKSEGKPQLKKSHKVEDKVKLALKDSFSSLVPLYETELKKITDTWVNTIYCSLSMRSNLVKLLYRVMPGINKAQFHMEDETILHCITRAKNYTRSEVGNLIQLIDQLIVNRNKTKDDCMQMLANKEIAEVHSNNWRALSKKIVDMNEETKQLHLDIPELMKNTEEYEKAAREKIEEMESSLSQKEGEIQKLSNQLSMLKQREQSYKGNVSLKIEDYKDIKEEVLMLKSIEKEFEELKTKYHFQNGIYENKIKELESVLEEKKKTLKKEKDVKKRLQDFLQELNSHQQHLYRTIGKEQVDFVMGRSYQARNKRREQLWLSAIKLVMKGFQVQVRKLERDRNKMLLELNSNNLENYNSLAAAIVQKDNFVKSIKHQMNSFQMAGKYLSTQTSESSVGDCVKN